MAEQLPLDLPHDPGLAAADFLESDSNAAALAMIEAWPRWPDRLLLLIGPEGSGKSHLARIFAARARAVIRRGGETAALIDDPPGAALVIEDADRAGLDERALFHLVNRILTEGGTLLMTARVEPDHWGLATKDLLSRLRRAPVLRIEPPDDAFLRALLVKLFLDRQLGLSTNVIEYLLPRMERSFSGAQRLVGEIDHLSLARKLRPSRVIAAEALQRLGFVETPTPPS
jgi:chromosomal replication initiation ATPase DnaA